MKKQKVILMIQNYFFHSQKNKMKLAKNNDILRKLANLTSNQLQKRNNFLKRKMNIKVRVITSINTKNRNHFLMELISPINIILIYNQTIRNNNK